jgi:antitoxin HicB
VYRYPVKLKRDTNRPILVTFPDVREAITFGDDEEDAVRRRLEALEAALSIYVDQGREIPRPSETASSGRFLSVFQRRAKQSSFCMRL